MLLGEVIRTVVGGAGKEPCTTAQAASDPWSDGLEN